MRPTGAARSAPGTTTGHNLLHSQNPHGESKGSKKRVAVDKDKTEKPKEHRTKAKGDAKNKDKANKNAKANKKAKETKKHEAETKEDSEASHS